MSFRLFLNRIVIKNLSKVLLNPGEYTVVEKVKGVYEKWYSVEGYINEYYLSDDKQMCNPYD